MPPPPPPPHAPPYVISTTATIDITDPTALATIDPGAFAIAALAAVETDIGGDAAGEQAVVEITETTDFSLTVTYFVSNSQTQLDLLRGNAEDTACPDPQVSTCVAIIRTSTGRQLQEARRLQSASITLELQRTVHDANNNPTALAGDVTGAVSTSLSSGLVTVTGSELTGISAVVTVNQRGDPASGAAALINMPSGNSTTTTSIASSIASDLGLSPSAISTAVALALPPMPPPPSPPSPPPPPTLPPPPSPPPPSPTPPPAATPMYGHASSLNQLTSDSGGVAGGMIGGIIGGAVLFAIIVAWFMYRKGKQSAKKKRARISFGGTESTTAPMAANVQAVSANAMPVNVLNMLSQRESTSSTATYVEEFAAEQDDAPTRSTVNKSSSSAALARARAGATSKSVLPHRTGRAMTDVEMGDDTAAAADSPHVRKGGKIVEEDYQPPSPEPKTRNKLLDNMLGAETSQKSSSPLAAALGQGPSNAAVQEMASSAFSRPSVSSPPPKALPPVQPSATATSTQEQSPSPPLTHNVDRDSYSRPSSARLSGIERPSSARAIQVLQNLMVDDDKDEFDSSDED